MLFQGQEAVISIFSLTSSSGEDAPRGLDFLLEPNRINVGSITKVQLEEIATIKLPDLNTTKLDSAMKIVEGTARNMGISIVD